MKDYKLNEREKLVLNVWKHMVKDEWFYDSAKAVGWHIMSIGGGCLVALVKTSKDSFIAMNDECFVVYPLRVDESMEGAFFDCQNGYELFVEWKEQQEETKHFDLVLKALNDLIDYVGGSDVTDPTHPIFKARSIIEKVEA